MRGSAGVLVIIGVVALIAAAVYFLRGNFTKTDPAPLPQPPSQSLSQDPKYTEVKEKYNLSEEQLQILSTVNPNDND